MRVFNNLNLLAKLAIPAVLLVVVSAGLVVLARASLATLERNTQRIVDVSAARLVTALDLGAAIDEATIHEKNVIIETDESRMADQHAGYQEAKRSAFAQIDRLIAMADTAERRSANEAIRGLLQTFFSASERAVAHGLKNENTVAARISNGEGRVVRVDLAKAVRNRVEANRRDLDLAKGNAAQVAAAASQTLTLVATVGLLLAIGALGSVAVFGVARPLTAMAGTMERLAAGDLDVAVTGIARRDEVGTLARSLQVFKDNAVQARAMAADQEAENAAKMRRAEALDGLTKGFERSVSALTHGLSAAATEMEATATAMAGTADQTTQQSMSVAGAAQQTSTNVQTVAAASEEMAASVQEIVQQVSQSARIADAAVAKAAHTDTTVQRLTATADRISTIVSVISGIAAQTNLLALNATIEAARAGAAGRGFAVVASEVKELAGQTAKATDEIGVRIGEIQGATQEAVRDIQEVGKIIGEMSSYTASIAAAMEEQGTASREITRNVQQAACGTEQVTASISGVREGAGQTSAAASQVLSAAQELARHSDSLSQEVASFLMRVKAA
ncbi:methyl-accepting chemotaxis protein [Methylobacterium sp. Gmos1]